MTSPHIPTDETPSMNSAPGKPRRRWLKVGFALLLMTSIGSAAAFHFLKSDPKPPSIAEYEKLDEDQAAAEERKAKETVERNQEALEKAQAAFEAAQAEWESAKLAKDEAEKKQESATLLTLSKAKQEWTIAEANFTQATAKRDEAKAKLKAAEDKLKSADQLRAEAEAERERVEKLIAQQETYRQALLGTWARPDRYGQFQLELKDDGRGQMRIDFNTATGFLVGTSQLEVDIQWKVANGDHILFDSLAGRPEKAFQMVTGLKGTHRDEVLIQIDEKSFSTHDANNKAKKESWTRVE